MEQDRIIKLIECIRENKTHKSEVAEACFEQLYKELRSLCLKIFGKFGIPSVIFDDLYHELLLRVIPTYESESFNLVNPVGYILKSAANLALEWLRRPKESISTDDESFTADREPVSDELSAYEMIRRQEMERILTDILETIMNEQEATIFVLRYGWGYSFKEIAIKLGLSYGYIRYLGSKALQKAKAKMDEDGMTSEDF